jgi:hypothetical protein
MYSKSPKPQTLVQLAEDGQSAVADTDVVWIPQNFQNTILARYPRLCRQGRRPLAVPSPRGIPGAVPSRAAANVWHRAMSVSSATMLSGG